MEDLGGGSYQDNILKILRFLDQYNFQNIKHLLENESGFSVNKFNLSHAKPKVQRSLFTPTVNEFLWTSLENVYPPLGSNGYVPTQPQTPPEEATSDPFSVPHQPDFAQPFAQDSFEGTSDPCPVPHQPFSAQPPDEAPVREPPIKRPRLEGTAEEVNKPLAALPAPPNSDDLPQTVIVIFRQGSEVKSLDFHPVQQTLLLAGTVNGTISIWEVGRKDWQVSQNFTIWDPKSCSLKFQESFADGSTASVNRVRWSPDGAFFGVAYSKHLVQLYSYHGGDVLQKHLEIDAHLGNVYDIAFSHQDEALYVITCGEDKTVKMWKAVRTGSKISPVRTFVGHEAPVYSVCPFGKDPKYIFSVDTNGKILAWIDGYALFTYDATPSWGRMACSANGRLFLCGTNKDGDSYLVEWDHKKCGDVKKTYKGLRKGSPDVVQFDTANSCYLAAGDEYQVKFWHMDRANMWTHTYASGGLPSCPCLRFNNGGTLLAVATCEDGIKVLANAGGLQLFRSSEKRSQDGVKVPAKAGGLQLFRSSEKRSQDGIKVLANAGGLQLFRSSEMCSLDGFRDSLKVGCTLGHEVVRSRIEVELEVSKVWMPREIKEPNILSPIWLLVRQTSTSPSRIIRLTYTKSGKSILALTYDALHEFWLWRRNKLNASGQATTSWPEECFCPSRSDVNDANVDAVLPSFALSDNGSYLLKTSRVENSLIKTQDFSTMKKFLPPPPAATVIAFLPQNNNIIAVGTNEASILIYDIHADELKVKLRGHTRSVTGLNFSSLLNVLVSSGSDCQLCVWSVDGWEMFASKMLEIPPGQNCSPLLHTRVHFDQDQIRFLAVHETQMGIYKAPNLECLKQWIPGKSWSSITDATYSSNGLSVYASFVDGSVCVFTASTLEPLCVIRPSAYLPPKSRKEYPVAVAACPTDPYQFALGLTDGRVVVLQPVVIRG